MGATPAVLEEEEEGSPDGAVGKHPSPLDTVVRMKHVEGRMKHHSDPAPLPSEGKPKPAKRIPSSNLKKLLQGKLPEAE